MASAHHSPHAVPEPSPPPPLVYAIGRIVINGARLELDVVILVRSAIGHVRPVHRSKPGKIKTQSDAFEQSLSDLRDIAHHRLERPLRSSVLDCADRAASVIQHRHLAAHGAWLALPDHSGRHGVTQLRSTGGAPEPLKHFSVGEADATVTEIHEVRSMLVPLLNRLVVALPEARPTVQQLPLDLDDSLRPGVAGGPLTFVER